MLPVRCNRTGDMLLEFHPDATLDDVVTLFTRPLIFSMIIPRCQNQTLFIYNAWRDEWEVPAGHIEEGETPYQAALRELEEESGQIAPSLKYVGLCLMQLANGQLDPGAIYIAELDALSLFKANAETTEMMLWDLQRPVTGHIDEISLWLVEQLAQR